MKIMYIAFMFHTNQVPIMKGWLENGYEVVFVSQTKGNTENHSVCKPILLGYSKVFQIINWIYKKVTVKKNKFSSFPEAFEGHYAFPSFMKLIRLYRSEKPEMIIFRDRSVYTIFCYVAAKICRIPSILYNQTPLYEEVAPRTDFLHRVMRRLSPRIRMTPVYGREGAPFRDSNAYYVPFVVQPQVEPQMRQYFKNDKINILCVAKYEERKNQMLLLEIIRELKSQYDFSVVFVGEVSTEHHRLFYDKINRFIQDNDMQDIVTLYKNFPPQKMGEHYKNADIFVLPSTKEFASISQLEAMAYSIPVIVSDTNGSACYVENGINGYTFRDNSLEDLKSKFSLLIAEPDVIRQMGKNSYHKVIEEYSFANYEKCIKELYNKVIEE